MQEDIKSKLADILSKTGGKTSNISELLTSEQGRKLAETLSPEDRKKIIEKFMSMDSKQIEEKLKKADSSVLNNLTAEEIRNKLR